MMKVLHEVLEDQMHPCFRVFKPLLPHLGHFLHLAFMGLIPGNSIHCVFHLLEPDSQLSWYPTLLLDGSIQQMLIFINVAHTINAVFENSPSTGGSSLA